MKDRKSAALKKIIASMTVGKDVSELFPDVAKCISTEGRGKRGSQMGTRQEIPPLTSQVSVSYLGLTSVTKLNELFSASFKRFSSYFLCWYAKS